MKLIPLSGTTAVSLKASPFAPSGGRNIVIVNLSGASVTAETSMDGTNWVALGAAVPAATLAERVLPGGAISIRLSAAGTAFVLAGV